MAENNTGISTDLEKKIIRQIEVGIIIYFVYKYRQNRIYLNSPDFVPYQSILDIILYNPFNCQCKQIFADLDRFLDWHAVLRDSIGLVEANCP